MEPQEPSSAPVRLLPSLRLLVGMIIQTWRLVWLLHWQRERVILEIPTRKRVMTSGTRLVIWVKRRMESKADGRSEADGRSVILRCDIILSKHVKTLSLHSYFLSFCGWDRGGRVSCADMQL